MSKGKYGEWGWIYDSVSRRGKKGVKKYLRTSDHFQRSHLYRFNLENVYQTLIRCSFYPVEHGDKQQGG